MQKICFALLVTLLSLSGCGVMDLFEDAQPAKLPPKPIAPTAVEQPSAPLGADQADAEVPFQLKVIQEINDGKRLYVHGTVKARTEWASENLMVRLTGLKEGRGVERAEYPLSQVGTLSGSDPQSAGLPGAAIPMHIPAGAEVAFVASIPSVQIDNYQLELMWGQESDAVIQAEDLSGVKLEIRGVRILRQDQNCSSGQCVVAVTLGAELVNAGTVPIGHATLAVDFSPGIPENEELVEVPNLSILPGESRPVRLVLEDLPAQGLAGYEPSVRVVSAEPVHQ